MSGRSSLSPNDQTIGPRGHPIGRRVMETQIRELRNPLWHYDHAGAESTAVRHRLPMLRLILSGAHT